MSQSKSVVYKSKKTMGAIGKCRETIVKKWWAQEKSGVHNRKKSWVQWKSV